MLNMKCLEELLQSFSKSNIALYGLGTETERFLAQYGEKISVVGLLDGFCESGDMYGCPIITVDEAVQKDTKLIIVIARPGSCKAIAKRIGETCREKGIFLYDVRGKDLLVENNVAYDFTHVAGESRKELYDKIQRVDIVSFDLFDTLVTRKVLSYTDLFFILENILKDSNIIISNFAKLRLAIEKRLSKDKAPTLKEIYEELVSQANVDNISADELVEMEWELELSMLVPRRDVCDVFKKAVSEGKEVYVTSDTYYRKEQIQQILSRFSLTGYSELLISCEEGTSKTLCLYDRLLDKAGNQKVLHIGDDELADVHMASVKGIEVFRLYSGVALFDCVGELGVGQHIHTLSDRLKLGLLISRLFNSPFWFEDKYRRVSVDKAYDVGYLFCAPIITDFVIWLKQAVHTENIKQIFFCARDGFLIEKLYNRIDNKINTKYFLTSRIAAIRAGMEREEDLEYVNSMKYFGSLEENLKVRFGIDCIDLSCDEYKKVIFDKARTQRKNYQKYIKRLNVEDGKIAVFDFVAKGTTQLYLQRLFTQHLKGFYFLQLEPEFMKDKKLDITPYYGEEEKNQSIIFDCYYILETLLTSLEPSILEFDDEGNAIYASETRSESDLICVGEMQQGVMDYFNDYINVMIDLESNKKLDETILALVGRILITDEDFKSLYVEDPFFGRMTDIKTYIQI